MHQAHYKKNITSYADDQHHGGHSPREINRQREQFDHYLNAHENTFIATQRAILYLVKMWERRRSEAELCTGLLSRTPTPWRLSPHHIFCTGLLEKKKQKTIYKFILGKPSRKPQYRNMPAQGETQDIIISACKECHQTNVGCRMGSRIKGYFLGKHIHIYARINLFHNLASENVCSWTEPELYVTVQSLSGVKLTIE